MTEQTVRLGRQDYGWGVPATVVTIDGEPFARVKMKDGSEPYFSHCGKCADWSGSILAFGHVLAGVCFDCNGRGWRNRYESRADVERLVKRRKADRARRARKEAERLAALEAKGNAWRAEHPELAARLAQIAEETGYGTGDPDSQFYAAEAARERYGAFVSDLAQRAEFGGLSPKQTTAVAEALAKADARHAEKTAASEASRHWGSVGDKVKATGVVTVWTTYDASYGYQTRTGAMVVIAGTGEHEGVTFKCSGTGATLWDASKGDTVEVAGTIRSHDMYEGVRQTVLTRAKVKVLG